MQSHNSVTYSMPTNTVYLLKTFNFWHKRTDRMMFGRWTDDFFSFFTQLTWVTFQDDTDDLFSELQELFFRLGFGYCVKCWSRAIFFIWHGPSPCRKVKWLALSDRVTEWLLDLCSQLLDLPCSSATSRRNPTASPQSVAASRHVLLKLCLEGEVNI